MAENKPNIGTLIDQLFEVREKIRLLNKQAEDLSTGKTELELKLIEALKTQGIEQSRGAKATATVTKAIVPQVSDWDKVYAFVLKHKLPYIFEKRISASVFREVLESLKSKKIPGIEPFEKVSISLRTVN